MKSNEWMILHEVRRRCLPFGLCCVLIGAVLSVPTPARADTQSFDFRLPKEFEFYIDTASFVRNARMFTSEDQVELWVLWAMNQWLSNTRKNIRPVYMGRMAVANPSPSGARPWAANHGDGVSTIYMTDNLTQTGVRAEAPPYCGPGLDAGSCGGRAILEWDIIFWHEPGLFLDLNDQVVGWEFDNRLGLLTDTNCQNVANNPGYYVDIMSILVHEIGHMLGLTHATNNDQVVMRNTSEGTSCGVTHRRHPTVADLRELEEAWGSRTWSGLTLAAAPTLDPTMQWFQINSNGSPSSSTFWEVDTWLKDRPGFNVAMGKRTSSTDGLVVTSLKPDWTGARVHRLAIGGGSWSRATLTSVDVGRVPDVAGKTDGSDMWILTGPRLRETMTCSSIRTWRTWNNFSNISRITLSDDCVFYSPSITYHEAEGLWVMAYVKRSYATGGAINGAGPEDSRIVLRWSSNGTDWSAPLVTNWYASTNVEVSCGDGECMLEWAAGNSVMPDLATAAFTLNSAGTLNWGTILVVPGMFVGPGNLHHWGFGDDAWLHTVLWSPLPLTPLSSQYQVGDDPLAAPWNFWLTSNVSQPSVAGHQDLAWYFSLRDL